MASQCPREGIQANTTLPGTSMAQPSSSGLGWARGGWQRRVQALQAGGTGFANCHFLTCSWAVLPNHAKLQWNYSSPRQNGSNTFILGKGLIFFSYTLPKLSYTHATLFQFGSNLVSLYLYHVTHSILCNKFYPKDFYLLTGRRPLGIQILIHLLSALISKCHSINWKTYWCVLFKARG